MLGVDGGLRSRTPLAVSKYPTISGSFGQELRSFAGRPNADWRGAQSQIRRQCMNSADQLSLYAPKRVRDAAHAERRGMAPKSQEGVEDSDAHQSTAASPAQDGGPVADHYRLARSLEPTLMP